MLILALSGRPGAAASCQKRDAALVSPARPLHTTFCGALGYQVADPVIIAECRLRAKEQANVVKFLQSYPGNTPKD